MSRLGGWLIGSQRIVAGGVLAGVVTWAGAAHAINIEFFNDTDQIAYLSFGGDNAPQGTLTVEATSPAGPLGFSYQFQVTNFSWTFGVQPHSKMTGLELAKFDAGKLLVSTGSALMSQHPAFAYMGAPSGNTQIDNDYNARHDKVELTIDGTHSQAANLSAADFYGLPLSVTTLKGGTEVASRSWVQSAIATATALAATAKSVGAVPVGPNGLPLNLSPPVVPTAGTNGVLRVISPTTAITSFGSSMQTYVDYVKNKGVDTHVVGVYSGSTHDQKPAADYDFHVTLVNDPAHGNETMAHFTGTVTQRDTHVATSYSFDIPAQDKNGRTLAQQVYLIDPAFTVNGNAYSMQNNDGITAAVRDFLAGFDYGLVGSEKVDPRTNVAFKDESTDAWYTEQGSPPRHLQVSEVFDGAAPCTGCYNEYAKEIAVASDNNVYGFSFSDVLGKPLIDLDPDKVDTMLITLLPDDYSTAPSDLLTLFSTSLISFSYADPVPEPASLAVFGTALGLMGMIRRSRRGRRS